MNLARGDVVLVPFPFTDLASSKVRPAIIISPNPKAGDIIVAFISSVVVSLIEETELLLKASHPDFPLTGLKRDSVLKLNKLITLHHTLILRRLGRLSPSLIKELDKRLKKAVGL